MLGKHKGSQGSIWIASISGIPRPGILRANAWDAVLFTGASWQPNRFGQFDIWIPQISSRRGLRLGEPLLAYSQIDLQSSPFHLCQKTLPAGDRIPGVRGQFQHLSRGEVAWLGNPSLSFRNLIARGRPEEVRELEYGRNLLLGCICSMHVPYSNWRHHLERADLNQLPYYRRCA